MPTRKEINQTMQDRFNERIRLAVELKQQGHSLSMALSIAGLKGSKNYSKAIKAFPHLSSNGKTSRNWFKD